MGRSKRGRRVRSNRNGAVRDTLDDIDPEKRRRFKEALKKRHEKMSSGKDSNSNGANRQTKRRGRNKGVPKCGVDQLLAKAEESLETFNFDMAKSFCGKALQMDPDNVSALEMMGDLLAESGDVEEAQMCFLKAVANQPDSGYTKYMYLGQLADGMEAVKHYEKGIAIMEKERTAYQDQQDQAASVSDCQVTGKEISQAYSTIAEIYLTDACFEDNAEERCKECLDKALEEDHRNAEAHQLLASYWLSKENKENAKASINFSLSLWLLDEKAESSTTQKSSRSQETEHSMTYPSRIECAKILMELEDYDKAESVLCGLLEDSDGVVQVWYMMGLLHVHRGTEVENQPYARYYLTKAKKLFPKIKCDDLPLLEHTEELLEKLGPGEGEDDDWLEKTQIREEELVDIGDDSDDEDSSSSDEEPMEQ